MDKFRKSIPVPGIINNSSGHSVTQFTNSTKDILYVAFEFVDGHTIANPTEPDYEKMGRAMRLLHDSADKIVNQVTRDWEGRSRPEYNLHQTVEEPLGCLLSFAPLTSGDKERCIKLARELTRRCTTQGFSRHFIHADLHFGNIVATPQRWVCLDFDECGFGHRALDIGVIRLHLMAAEQQERHWNCFKEGYGMEFSNEEIHVGTALRIFYMAGKIPLRQDLQELRTNPAERIRRYLGYVESEVYT